MTALAAIAELTGVHVVAQVAARAAGGCGRHAGRGGLVASFAGQIGMSARQRESRLQLVIERPEVPAAGAVAAGAVGSQTAAMVIVPAMAAGAGLPGIFEGKARVTLLAACQPVQAQKRKVRELVIETGGAAPAVRIVAVAADRQLVPVRIIRCVTVLAIRWQRILQRSQMAALAAQVGMGPGQREAGATQMIERHVPGILAVAGSAVAASLTPVRVIDAVAAGAGRRRLVE